MKALVYHGPGKISLDEKPKPRVEKPTDAIIKISKTTICGTDLHILKGDVATVKPGRTLGHEGVGIIESVGDEVSNFRVGDKVLISCITSCGRCRFCRNQMYSHCEFGGWILGNEIDGTQAEYVRVPFADTSLHAAPKGVDEETLVMFSDVLPTGYETGVLRGHIKLGDVVAIIGAGPIGLSALLTAQFCGPSEIIMIDPDEYRLRIAKKLGATLTISEKNEKATKVVMQKTHKQGVDVAIEAVGTPEAFDICQSIIAPGGYIANIGVHGKSVSLHLEKLWHENITLTTALVDTSSIPTLLKVFKSGNLKPDQLITHRFKLQDVLKAYKVFKDAANQHALKVILEN
jgi:alcohol dehydrogenase